MSGPLGPSKPRWTGPELRVCDGDWCVVIQMHTDNPEKEAEACLKKLRWTSAQFWPDASYLNPTRTWGRR